MAEFRFDAALRGAQSGDQGSFDALWRSFNPRLVRFLRGLCTDDEAMDVASTVWLEVVRSIVRFEGDEDQFRAFLYTVGRRRVIDLRRRRSRRLHEEPIDVVLGRGAEPTVPERDEPENRSALSASTYEAIELVRSLSPDQAEVVLLRVVGGFDITTIASIVDKKPGAVRALLHRGLRRLQHQLAGVEGSHPQAAAADSATVTSGRSTHHS